jgi:hypothetical protein
MQARWASLAAACAASFALAGGGVLWALDAAGIPHPDVDLSVGLQLSEGLRSLAQAPRRGALVLFLGDSLAMDTSPPDDSIPTRLARALSANWLARRDLELRRVVGPGIGGFSHYFLSEEAAAARPDVVVLGLNLHWFARPWNQTVERPVLVGWLPMQRWPEAAALPLHAVRVSADLAVTYRALVASGALRAWHRLRQEQLRAVHGRRSLESWLQQRAGFPVGLGYSTLHLTARARRVGFERVTREGAGQMLGEVLRGIDPGNPTLQAVDRLLARHAAAGEALVVYAAPINVEHLRELGVYDAAGVARTLALLEASARRHGARWLDLHALLPDAAFADLYDHLETGGELDPTGRVAQELARAVLAALLERARQAH